MENKWMRYEKYSNYDEDASYTTWTSLYLKVYPQIDIFRNNFVFAEPIRVSGGNISRLVVRAKKGSDLDKCFHEELIKCGIPEDVANLAGDFFISGDTDFNIKDVECHKLENYSLIPRTGNFNNEKGKKGKINDNFLLYINMLSSDLNNFIENPKAFNGRYKDKLKPYRLDIVKCARRAYFSLFNNNIETYFFCLYFYGISQSDKQYEEAKNVYDAIIKNGNNNEKEIEIAKQFWEIRRNILVDKYGIQIKE